jgi:hypothetical protein
MIDFFHLPYVIESLDDPDCQSTLEVALLFLLVVDFARTRASNLVDSPVLQMILTNSFQHIPY